MSSPAGVQNVCSYVPCVERASPLDWEAPTSNTQAHLYCVLEVQMRVFVCLGWQVLVDLGPAFVKIGQALSSRPDVLPPEYTTELELLQVRSQRCSPSDII